MFNWVHYIWRRYCSTKSDGSARKKGSKHNGLLGHFLTCIAERQMDVTVAVEPFKTSWPNLAYYHWHRQAAFLPLSNRAIQPRHNQGIHFDWAKQKGMLAFLWSFWPFPNNLETRPFYLYLTAIQPRPHVRTERLYEGRKLRLETEDWRPHRGRSRVGPRVHDHAERPSEGAKLLAAIKRWQNHDSSKVVAFISHSLSIACSGWRWIAKDRTRIACSRFSRPGEEDRGCPQTGNSDWLHSENKERRNSKPSRILSRAEIGLFFGQMSLEYQ